MQGHFTYVGNFLRSTIVRSGEGGAAFHASVRWCLIPPSQYCPNRFYPELSGWVDVDTFHDVISPCHYDMITSG